MAARRGGRGSRTGTFFVLVGILGVLSATFLAGFWTGHNWPVLFGPGRPPDTAEAPAARRGAAAERSRPPRPPDALPALTFYDELKAPLTAPPPPPPRAKTPKPVEPVRRESVAEAAPPAAASEPTTPVAATPTREAPAPSVMTSPPHETTVPAPRPEAAAETPTGGFTVQVAAYNVRSPAEALRATLAAAGHDARVVEAATPSGVRYRVQVGTFVTRQAAQDAAARLTAERALSTFITAR
jgi:cell division protein FtsN